MGVEDDIADGKSRRLNQIGVIARFPNEDIPYKMLLTFTQYEYATSSSLLDSTSTIELYGESIVLPLPLQLQDSTSIKAAPFSMTQPVLNAAKGLASDAGALLQYKGLASALSSRGKRGMSKYFNIGTAAAQGAGGEALKNIDTIASIGGVTTGQAINPFETMMFEGVNLKKHSFSWRLSPSTSDESISVKNIVSIIKKNTLPLRNYAGLGFKYPNIANITFYGIDQEYYYKLKPCMITNIDVKYNNGEQLSVYRGGRPVLVELNLELTELTVHTSEDYDGELIADATQADRR